jgi:hypothetical protein
MVGADDGEIVTMVEDHEEFFDASSSHGSDDYFDVFPNFNCAELDNIPELM